MKCPSCGSRNPAVHPTITTNGKVQIMFCADSFHDTKKV